MSTRNQFSHKFVWDENGVGSLVIVLNEDSEENESKKDNNEDK